MNYGAEPADQVVRYYLAGTEVALKLTGAGAKNFAIFVAAVLKDQKKTHGKTNLVRLLREQKPLKFFDIPAERMYEFAKEAKRHGLLYVPIRDNANPDVIEVAILEDDAAKVSRIIDRMQLDAVGLRSVGPQLSGSETGERSKEGPSGAFHHQSGFALQTGGPEGRQAVETGSASVVDEIEQDRQVEEGSAPTGAETVETEIVKTGEEELFNTGFTPAADTTPQPTLDLDSGNPSGPSLPSKEPSPPPFAFRSDRQRAKGERPSVRLELGEIRTALLARQKGDPQIPMPKTPTKIKRDRMVL